MKSTGEEGCEAMKQKALAYNGRREDILLMLGFEFLVF
jgi:hypothetical protein